MNARITFQQKIHEDEFYTVLKSRVAAYFRQTGQTPYGNVWMFCKALFYFLLYISLYILILAGRFPGGTTLLLGIGFGVSGLLMAFNISHDANHTTFTGRRRLDKIIYYLTFNSQGTNAYLWQLRHLQSHHLFPNMEGCDADIDGNALLRLSPNKPWHWFHRYQFAYALPIYAFFTLNWIVVRDFVMLTQSNYANIRNIRHPQGEVMLCIFSKLAYVGYALVVPMWVLSFAWYEVLLGFWLMHCVTSYVFVFTLAGSHFSDGNEFPSPDEKGNVTGSWARHQVATSLDFDATSWMANFLFGGFNSHVAHHLFPHVCHIHYVVISRLIRETALEYHYPYRETTLPGLVAAHFRHLRKMGATPIKNLRLFPPVTALLSILLLSGCVHRYYAPNGHHVTLFTGKEVASLSIGYSGGDEIADVDVQTAVAVSNRIGLMANGAWRKDGSIYHRTISVFIKIIKLSDEKILLPPADPLGIA